MIQTVTANLNRSTAIVRALVLISILWIGVPGPVPAQSQMDQDLVLVVQPLLNQEQTRETYGPLAAYLTRITGRNCTLRTTANFLAHWSQITRVQGNTIYLDAAHFTAYRSQKMGYKVIAKVPDEVTYSLIVSTDNPIVDPSRLAAKRIATLGSHSIGAARLMGMFPNPARQPIIVEVPSARSGIDMVAQKRISAAIIPTPDVGRALLSGKPIRVVITTEPIPRIAVSLSPDIDAGTVNKVRQALLSAARRPDGKRVLENIGFTMFEPANAGIYRNQDKILKIYWGY